MTVDRPLQLQTAVPGAGVEQPRPQGHPQDIPHDQRSESVAARRQCRPAEAHVAGTLADHGQASVGRLAHRGCHGSVRTRSGDEYKPSALRGYERAMRLRVLPEIGGVRLTALTRVDLQDLADRWLAKGLDPSTIRNTLMPMRALYRRALSSGDVSLNPTNGIELPAVRGRHERIATPEQAAALIAAAPDDQALWATALYAGLRRGELMALRWEDRDLKAELIRVERSWDMKDGIVEPKSRAGNDRCRSPRCCANTSPHTHSAPAAASASHSAAPTSGRSSPPPLADGPPPRGSA